jgi:hypothetical protein
MERHSDALVRLADVLLGAGGERIIVPHHDPELMGFLMPSLLERGRFFVSKNTPTLELGEPRRCHANALALSRAGRGSACIGFGLSDDEQWRSHSWVWTPSGEIVETTLPHISYYGVKFEDSELFASG